MSRFDEIQKNKYTLSEEERLKLNLKPKEIPSLPTGEDALKPTTKAGWQTEAIKRAIISNLHNGANWKTFFIYGGSGQAIRNWEAFYSTIKILDNLKSNETIYKWRACRFIRYTRAKRNFCK